MVTNQASGRSQRVSSTASARFFLRRNRVGKIQTGPSSPSWELQPIARGPDARAGWCSAALSKIRQTSCPRTEVLAQNGIVQPVDGDVTNASAGGKGSSGYRGERTEPAGAHLAPARPTILEPEIVMMRKKRQAVARRECRQLIGKDQIARKAQILRPDEGFERVGLSRSNAPARSGFGGESPRAAIVARIDIERLARRKSEAARPARLVPGLRATPRQASPRMRE